MSPPITYRTVTGKYTKAGGAPETGTLRFIPSTTVYDTADNEVVTEAPIEVTLVNGEFTVELGVTDSPDTTPTGWYWIITEKLSRKRTRTFQLPSGPPLAEIVDLLPGEATVELYGYATLGYATSLDARLTAVEAQSAVTFAGVGVHPFLLMGA